VPATDRAAGRRYAGAARPPRGRTAAMRAPSGIGAVSIACQVSAHAEQPLRRDESRGDWASVAPSSSTSSNGWISPSRLTMRLASLVAMISRRSRWPRISRLNLRASVRGRRPAARRPGPDRRAVPRLRAPSCKASFALDSSTASSGRVSPRPSAARRSDLAVGQPFGLAVELAGALERLDQRRMRCGRLRPAGLGNRQRQRLQPVVFEHERGDFVGHRWTSSLTRAGFGQPPGALGRGQRDLDVDLVVRAIDAGRIVDEVGVDPPALQRELDAPGLRAAKVGTFADHLGAQVAGR
jgi:hypothetical protein